MHVSCSYFSGKHTRTLNIRTNQDKQKNPNPHYENPPTEQFFFWEGDAWKQQLYGLWLVAYSALCTIILYILFHPPLFPFSVKILCTNSTLFSMNKEENPCQHTQFWRWSALGYACTLWQCLRFGGWPQPGDRRRFIRTETHKYFQIQMRFSPAKDILFKNLI